MKIGALLIAVPLLAAQNGAVIEGTAFNRITRAGVPDVTIRLALAFEPGKQLHTAKSDAAGAFRIEDVQTGDYVATFDAPNGFLAPQGSDPACKPFHVGAGGDSLKFQVPVMPLGKLRGRVLDGEGRPVPRVQVELFRVHFSGGSIMTTDAEGGFSQDGLIPGAYQLRARPVLPGAPMGRRPEALSPVPAKPPEGDRWMWAPTYFPNAIEIGGAETIVVREGTDLAGYVIQLRSAPVYRLHGTAVDSAGSPASGVVLQLLSETGWSAAEAEATSGENGAFEFPSVRSSKWSITAVVKRDKTTWKGFTQLSMPKHDLEDVSVRLFPPFTIDGAIEGMTPRSRRAQSPVIVPLLPTVHGEESVAVEQPTAVCGSRASTPARIESASGARFSGDI